MAVVKCAKNHYYDNEKYSECPICTSGLPHIADVLETQKVIEYAEEYIRNYEEEHAADGRTGHEAAYAAFRLSRDSRQERSRPMPGQDGNASRQERPRPMPGQDGNASRQERPRPMPGQDGNASRQERPRPMPGQDGNDGRQGWEAPVREPYVPSEGQDDGLTVRFSQLRKDINPTAGWLVCIEGEDFGSSFEIKGGRNLIGRAPDMDVVLHGDGGIVARNHAAVFYEPKKREFFVQAMESLYLNGTAILQPVKLEARDILAVGNTRLMFFPCCGEDFGWDDYEKPQI